MEITSFRLFKKYEQGTKKGGRDISYKLKEFPCRIGSMSPYFSNET